MHGLRLKTSTAAELAHSGRPELCKQEDVDLMSPVKQPTVEWLQFWGIRADWPLGLASQSASLAESLNQQASVKARNPAPPLPPYGGFAFTPDNCGLHLGSCKVVGDNQLLRVVHELP